MRRRRDSAASGLEQPDALSGLTPTGQRRRTEAARGSGAGRRGVGEPPAGQVPPPSQEPCTAPAGDARGPVSGRSSALLLNTAFDRRAIGSQNRPRAACGRPGPASQARGCPAAFGPPTPAPARGLALRQDESVNSPRASSSQEGSLSPQTTRSGPGQRPRPRNAWPRQLAPRRCAHRHPPLHPGDRLGSLTRTGLALGVNGPCWSQPRAGGQLRERRTAPCGSR